jgi:hypothetical protein
MGERVSIINQFYSWIISINWTPEAITAAGTVSLACLTFILAFGTIFLWRATIRLVKSAEQTAERQLRAYVSVEITAHPSLDALFAEAAFKIKNRGQTPTHKMTQWVGMDVLNFPPDENIFSPPPKDMIDQASQRPLAPSAEVSFYSKLNVSLSAGDKGTIDASLFGAASIMLMLSRSSATPRSVSCLGVHGLSAPAR